MRQTLSDKKRFNLHLPGLLKVLAEHLYSTKRVAVRELLQNGHDSCVRRRIEEGEHSYRPRIDLAVDVRALTLSFRDNGCGLTEEEIHTYLATIGRGYTRELRERLALSSPEEAAELIGQFGLGFLSAFLLAAEVTVTTRSIRGGPALRWHSTGDEFFDLRPIEDTTVGTTVVLSVKPAVSFMLQERHLIDAVRTYADFMPTPIYIAGEEVPLTPSVVRVLPMERLHDARTIAPFANRHRARLSWAILEQSTRRYFDDERSGGIP
jgi:molecular chaperone HtpG